MALNSDNRLLKALCHGTFDARRNTEDPLLQLIPWSFHTELGFTLRGYRTEASGKPVLHMLHGNGFCSRMYQPMLQRLIAHYDIFLSDAQGHGDSDHGGAFVGWNRSAELAKHAWLAHRHLYGEVEVFGVGHSFGGVLTALIHTSSASPFTGAVLLDPVLFTPTMLTVMRSLNGVRLYHKNPLAKAALRRRQHWPDRDSAFSYLHNRGMFANWREDALAAYIDHALKPTEQGLSLKCLPQREADIFASYPENLWQQLAQNCPPLHVIYAERSYDFIVKAISKWQRRNPAVSSEMIPGGHCFMQEQPELAAQRLLHALSNLKTSLK